MITKKDKGAVEKFETQRVFTPIANPGYSKSTRGDFQTQSEGGGLCSLI